MTNYRIHRYLNIVLLSLGMVAMQTTLAQEVQVNSADPPAAEQGTVNLDINIAGKGFDNSADVFFFVTGTEDSGGITVNTIKVRGPKKIIANINVSETAIVSDFDIEVRLSRGRGGKGTTLFRVLKKGGNDEVNGGESIPLRCSFNEDIDNARSDGLGDYVDGLDKVFCSTGGTVQPNLSGIQLETTKKGPLKRAIRKLDLVLGLCADAACSDGSYLPPEIFEAGPTIGEMEDVNLHVRPYIATQDHIQLLTPDHTYEMALRINLLGMAGKTVINLARESVLGDIWQGVRCDIPDQTDALTDDVTVYVWPDDDLDGLPDGYTATTGAIVANSGTPPEIIDAPRRAMICSSEGPIDCHNVMGEVCNKLGEVDLQFTLHGENL